MSSDRITHLHEQASERYLNGDYDGALQAWRDVLTMDPGNEQAMDGVRMASQFVEPTAAPVAAHPEVESELDQGLKVFDSLIAPAGADLGATMILSRSDVDGMIDRKPAPASAPELITPDPLRQSEGIDFGDLSAVDPIPLGAERPAGPEDAPAAEDFGLAPAADSSAASMELHRRVADLLTEARAKADAGDREEALTILSRLAILDEDNADAAELRARLQEGGASDLDRIEESIIEGVAALEADRLDEAERLFRDALALSPGHREAQHYLEKVEERRSGTALRPPAGAHGADDLLGNDLLGDLSAVDMPVDAPVPLAKSPAEAPVKAKSPRAPRQAVAEPLEAVAPRPTSRLPLPPLKWVALGGIGAIALVCAAIALPHLTGGSAKTAPVPPPPRPAKTAKPAKTRPAASTPSTTAAAPMSAADRAKAVSASIGEGRSRMSAGDFGAAVVSFNEALQLDPANTDAKSGLDEAAGLYKARKAEQDSLDSIRLAFRDGEYTAALRLAYRLPPSIPKSYTDGVKVAGWYNLAVVALRAGDCREAISHLDEALGIVPGDGESTKLREFANRYSGAPKDRSFLDQVESLAFRTIPKL